jgi:membrane-bound ClpP family serine protease
VFVYIAILIILGILLLVLEILIIPGLIAGIVGVAFMLIGIIWTFKEYGNTVGIYTSVATVLLTGTSLYIAFKSRVWSRFSLKQDLSDSRANVIALGIVEGDEAITISTLRPMGTVMIDNIKMEARSNGELIPENRKVVVIKVNSNGLVVKEA